MPAARRALEYSPEGFSQKFSYTSFIAFSAAGEIGVVAAVSAYTQSISCLFTIGKKHYRHIYILHQRDEQYEKNKRKYPDRSRRDGLLASCQLPESEIDVICQYACCERNRSPGAQRDVE